MCAYPVTPIAAHLVAGGRVVMDDVEMRAETVFAEPPSPPFKLLHIKRIPELDRVDKQAFDVFIELLGFMELDSPCLYFLAPQERRCGFALAEHSPPTHNNQLMMTLVDQDNVYEDLSVFEERVRARARRLVAVPARAGMSLDAIEMVEYADDRFASVLSEPPAWAVEAISADYGNAVDSVPSDEFEG